MKKGALHKNPTWIVPERRRGPEKSLFNCAIFQENIDITDNLERSLYDETIQFHFFRNSEELIRCCKRYPLDLIVIAVDSGFSKACRLVVRARAQMFLSIIPIVLYYPGSNPGIYQCALECEADELLIGPWEDLGFGVRLKMLISRAHRDLGVNPSSRLPGPTQIENKINQAIEKHQDFAVCYLDIDNFKAYNDYYGYFYGDKVVRLTAQIIRDIVFDLVPNGFVGHIGGDDYIFIIPYAKIDAVCSNIIKTFDRLIPYRYRAEDRERGKIITKNRFDQYETYPLLTVSIAVLVCQDGAFSHAGEMSHMLADLKKYTKKLAGSNYMIERRRKY